MELIVGLFPFIFLGLVFFGNDDVRGVILGLMALSSFLGLIYLIFADFMS